MYVVTEPCILDILTYSASKHITVCEPQYGSVKMNGILVWEGYFCFDPPLRRRGVNLLLVDPSNCTLRTDPITFETNNVVLDTFNTSLTPDDLLKYLKFNLMQGDVVVGLSFDEAFHLMNETIKDAFRQHLGIDFAGREMSDGFAFVAQKGFLGKKVLDVVPEPDSKTDPARLKVAVTGTELYVYILVAATTHSVRENVVSHSKKCKKSAFNYSITESQNR